MGRLIIIINNEVASTHNLSATSFTNVVRRDGVFETNSSSMHSIVMSNETYNGPRNWITREEAIADLLKTDPHCIGTYQNKKYLDISEIITDFTENKQFYCDFTHKMAYVFAAIGDFENHWYDDYYEDTHDGAIDYYGDPASPINRYMEFLKEFLGVDKILCDYDDEIPYFGYSSHNSFYNGSIYSQRGLSIKDFILNPDIYFFTESD